MKENIKMNTKKYYCQKCFRSARCKVIYDKKGNFLDLEPINQNWKCKCEKEKLICITTNENK